MSHLTFKNCTSIIVVNTNVYLLFIILLIWVAIKLLVWNSGFVWQQKIQNKLIWLKKQLLRIVMYIASNNGANSYVYNVKLLYIDLLVEKEFIFLLSNYYIKYLYSYYNLKFNKIQFNGLLSKSKTITLDVFLKLKKQLTLSYDNTIKINQIDEKQCNFIVKPYAQECISSNNSIKFFIRNAKCFNKTKYSFIRQECKTIVYLTLLINIIVILLTLNTYMHWRLINLYIYTFIIIYNIIFIKSLFKLFTVFKQFRSVLLKL